MIGSLIVLAVVLPWFLFVILGAAGFLIMFYLLYI